MEAKGQLVMYVRLASSPSLASLLTPPLRLTKLPEPDVRSFPLLRRDPFIPSPFPSCIRFLPSLQQPRHGTKGGGGEEGG